MFLLDAALRFSAITMLCLAAVFALRDARYLLQSRLAAALCISLSAMLINTLSAVHSLPPVVETVSWLLHIPNTVFLWLFGLSLFEDDFRMGRLHWGVLGAVFVMLILIRVGLYLDLDTAVTIGFTINRIIGFSMLAHLFWRALSGRRDDLIEGRRATRLWFTLGLSLVTALILTGETAQFVVAGTDQDQAWMSTLRVGVAWPMIAFGVLWYLRLQPENFLFETVAPTLSISPEIDPKDAATHRQLVAHMEDGAFKQPGLTIGALAEELRVPEHQLRALINQGLGFRNFAAFLNTYRIAYAKSVLEDPEHARVQVLTIAMDAGYGSLAPFNRAFKAVEGVTPTAFRQAALLDADRD